MSFLLLKFGGQQELTHSASYRNKLCMAVRIQLGVDEDRQQATFLPVAVVFSLPGIWKIDHTVCLLLLRQTESAVVVDFSEINPKVHFFICTVHSALKSSCCLCMNREGETNPVYRFSAPEMTSVGRVSKFKAYWYVLCNLPHINFLFRWIQNLTGQHSIPP